MIVLTEVNFLVVLGDTVFLLLLEVDYAVQWGRFAWFAFCFLLTPPRGNVLTFS